MTYNHGKINDLDLTFQYYPMSAFIKSTERPNNYLLYVFHTNFDHKM